MRRRAAQPAPCSCPDCHRLDLEFPGEGRQLALADVNDPPAAPDRRRAARGASAPRHLQQPETAHV